MTSHSPLASINLHINRDCDAACRFCYATFRDTRRARIPTEEAQEILTRLRGEGRQKVNFAGGEPTLHRGLPDMIEHAKHLGFTTSVVTNGSRMAPVLDRCGDALDWVVLSVDSASEETEMALGRSNGTHIDRAVSLAQKARAHGCRVKLNTVVSALNVEEDLTDLVLRLRPDRWKILQVMPVAGQNDLASEALEISRTSFDRFVARHAPLASQACVHVPEPVDVIRGSYLMVGPDGRFFDSTSGRHRYSDRIVEVGVETALQQVAFSPVALAKRGGLYDWAGAATPQ